MIPTRRLTVVSFGALGVAALGCDDLRYSDNSPFRENEPEQRSAEPGQAEGDREVGMGDAQIMGTLNALNLKEIELSRTALEVTENQEVKAFAEKMIKDHTAALAQTKNLASSLGEGDLEADRAQKLLNEMSSSVERLEGLSSGERDKAYIDMMVADHKAALDLIDSQLLPSAQSPELKRLIQDDLRPTIESHYREAKELASRFGSARTTAL